MNKKYIISWWAWEVTEVPSRWRSLLRIPLRRERSTRRRSIEITIDGENFSALIITGESVPGSIQVEEAPKPSPYFEGYCWTGHACTKEI